MLLYKKKKNTGDDGLSQEQMVDGLKHSYTSTYENYKQIIGQKQKYINFVYSRLVHYKWYNFYMCTTTRLTKLIPFLNYKSVFLLKRNKLSLIHSMFYFVV